MADKVNLQIDQGSTFFIDFIVKNYSTDTTVDLSSYTGAGQIRRTYSSSNSVPISVNVFANGTVRAGLSANQTQSLLPEQYVYDIEIQNNAGEITRIVEGIITITPEVTK